MIEEATQKHIDEVIVGLGSETIGMPQVATLDDLNHGQGFIWALCKKGTAIAVGGIRELWPGTGEIWMLATKAIQKCPIEVSKALKGALRRADEAGFFRIQCAVNIHFVESQKWVERAGFDMEAMLESYINRENYFMYARVKHG